VGDSEGNWFLVNASPDLRAQIEECSDLQPHSSATRNTPISGVLLTNADLDHVVGIFALREGNPINLHATSQVRSTVQNCLGVTNVLESLCGTIWHEPPMTRFSQLAGANGPAKRLLYRAIALPGQPPRFTQKSNSSGAHTVAYEFLDENTGGRLIVAPGVPGTNVLFCQALAECDAVLFDGTFWSDGELAAVKPGAPRAEEIGHVTIKDSSLSLLAGLTARHKIYTHINNTNPILDTRSSECRAVEAAGLVVGYDGLEFEL
jgi:pyrroloquinoline quinone biosynthesis protein B